MSGSLVNAGLILNIRPLGATERFSEIGIMTAADIKLQAGKQGEKFQTGQESGAFQAILT
ncbi:hypothetical protein D0868_16345 [Hortaea werneckii]|uniref:Uncharacterized protein n=1 Tax=Hortaea werneckii TaxID=91943 RepID=A0A3M6WL37_HORWE|nr:hypothetical protein D0868_16345 [Hortaea werneckii]